MYDEDLEMMVASKNPGSSPADMYSITYLYMANAR